MSFIIRLLLSVLAVWLTVILGKEFGLGLDWIGIWQSLLFVVVLALVNAIIRPIVKLIVAPLTCLTFGLFSFIVNALLFWATASLSGLIKVETFWAALFGSAVYGILSGIIGGLVKFGSKNEGE
jgi:putative membrane protein